MKKPIKSSSPKHTPARRPPKHIKNMVPSKQAGGLYCNPGTSMVGYINSSNVPATQPPSIAPAIAPTPATPTAT